MRSRIVLLYYYYPRAQTYNYCAQRTHHYSTFGMRALKDNVQKFIQPMNEKKTTMFGSHTHTHTRKWRVAILRRALRQTLWTPLILNVLLIIIFAKEDAI